ncbi:unnamed protein product [Adineta steineri]|uniref:G-protein coupled receptors family 1 profile domain-containing protein n=1 Tax=Adineta steineri TaxID=433720 RepID=A0A819NV59_9BILA|nr:unnamed protein product [Adineta steineri]
MSANNTAIIFQLPSFDKISTTTQNLSFYGFLFLFIFGFVGNISNLVIFSGTSLRKASTSLLFIFLAISDTGYLLTCIYEFIYYGFNIKDPNVGTSRVSALCRFRSYFQATFICLSSWLLVAISADRSIRIMFPFKAKTLCTRRHAIYVTTIILLTFLALNAHYLTEGFGTNQGQFIFCYADFRNTQYLYFYAYQWPIILSVFQIFLPALCIFLFSLLIYKHRHHPSTVIISVHRRFLEVQLLRLMISSSLLFLLTTFPLGLWNTIGPRFLTFVTIEQIHTYISILYFIQSINYSINFYVYVCSSKFFRKKILRILHFNFGQKMHPLAMSESMNINTVQSKTKCECFRKRKLLWIIVSTIIIAAIIATSVMVPKIKKVDAGNGSAIETIPPITTITTKGPITSIASTTIISNKPTITVSTEPTTTISTTTTTTTSIKSTTTVSTESSTTTSTQSTTTSTLSTIATPGQY